MYSKTKRLILLVFGLLLAAPCWADQITMLDGFSVQTSKVGLTSDKVEFRSSGGTGKATVKYADSVGNSRTYSLPDAGAAADFVMTAGNQTIAGIKTFSSAPAITGGLTAANIQSGSAKRELLRANLSPNTGAAADSTVYKALLFPGRAGAVKAVTLSCKTAPIGGTDTLKVLKASSAGNTMLSTATVDATTLTNNTGTAGTLTATGADLALTASQGIYCEYSAGVQTTDAEDVAVTVEYEPTDF